LTEKFFPEVAVIVLNHNGKKFLDDCFNSIRLTTYSNYRIYLLDNASTDDDVTYVRSTFPEVHIIQNSENNGFCAAYNLAFTQCTGKYFLCLNNDVKVKPDWLTHLVNVAEEDDMIAALQPKIVSFFDEHKFEYAGSSGGMMDIYGFPFLRGRVFDTIEDDNGQYDDISDIFWSCGAACFIRASVLKEIGIFDETIVHHMDEIDLNWRMHLMGYKVKVVPQSIILHYGGATIQQQSFKKMYWNHRNSLYLLLKNYGIKNAISKSFVHVLLDYIAIGKSVVSLEFTRALAIFYAHLWITLNIFLINKKRNQVQKMRTKNDDYIRSKFYPKSVVWQYFFSNKKTYTELIKH